MAIRELDRSAPAGESAVVVANRAPMTYVLPTAMLLAGSMLLVISIFLPYWGLTLHAPQYPKGLAVELYVNRVAGDVQELDTLNHYIGMAKLEQGAALERSLSVVAIVVLALLLASTVFIHNRWAGLLALPAGLYPVIFLVDLYSWLYRFGHHLDPQAPLSTSIKPFTPTRLGEGRIAQFRTTASLEEGFYLALASAALVLAGLYFHRRAYKPLVDARRLLRAQGRGPRPVSPGTGRAA